MDQGDNARSGIVSIIALCGFGLLVALAFPLWSSVAFPWLDSMRARLTANPSPMSSPPVSDGSHILSSWSDMEIRAALIQCVQSVAPLDAELDPIDPIREAGCGTPAPVLLKSLSSRDKVAFDPPLVVNCQMVESLHRWLSEAVQPAAKEAFGSPVSKIIGSSYACRTAYNDPSARLSQHAFANAVDLPIFVLADGRKVDVTRGWGPTKRDLVAAARIAGAKGVSSQPTIEAKKVTATELVKVSTAQATTDTKQADGMAFSTTPNSAEAKFLRLALKGACKNFTTVLGPEFNDVHRTHFHLDLQDRSSANVCK